MMDISFSALTTDAQRRCEQMDLIRARPPNTYVMCVSKVAHALTRFTAERTSLDIKAAGAQGGDVTTDTAEETESETESASSGYPPFGSVESVVNSYGLMLVKYSVRLCITCENEQDLSDFTALYGAFEFCGYEIFSKK